MQLYEVTFWRYSLNSHLWRPSLENGHVIGTFDQLEISWRFIPHGYNSNIIDLVVYFQAHLIFFRSVEERLFQSRENLQEIDEEIGSSEGPQSLGITRTASQLSLRSPSRYALASELFSTLLKLQSYQTVFGEKRQKLVWMVRQERLFDWEMTLGNNEVTFFCKEVDHTM